MHIFLNRTVWMKAHQKNIRFHLLFLKKTPNGRDYRKAIENAKEAFKGKWNGKIPNNLKTPLRDGDIDREDDPNYENAYFINATSQNAPGVVSPAMVRLNEPGSVVSGDYIRAVINFYGYNVNGNKGIAAGLNNIQLVEKGEPLGGASAAEDDFDELDTDDEDFL